MSPKPDLRVVPKPVASCPPAHRDEVRRELARQLRAMGTKVAALSDACSEIGDSSAAVDLAGVVERFNRLAARIEPDDVG